MARDARQDAERCREMAAQPAPQPATDNATACPNCGHAFLLKAETRGQRIRCLGCGAVLAIPAAGCQPGPLSVQLLIALGACPHCNQLLKLRPDLDARRIRCCNCHAVLRVRVRPALVPNPADSLTADAPLPAAAAVRVASATGQPPTAAPPVHLHADHPEAHEREEGERETEENEREEGWQSDDDLEHSGWQPADDADDEILFDADQTSPDLSRGGAPTASAVAEPLAKTSRTRPSTSTIPNGTRGISVQPTYRRSAQPTLARSRGAALPIAVAVLLSVGALSGGGFWLFSGPAGPPQTRYLPRDCNQLVSVKWSDVPAEAAAAASPDLPGLKLVDRCRIFLHNAGLRDEDVERVSAGQAVDGSGTVIVYQLTRAVRAAVVMDLPPFRTRRKKAEPSEMIGDVPLYALGPTVIAFPEPQVILNGETDLVRQILRRWSHQLAQPLRGYLQAADLTATSVVIAAGGPAPAWLEELQVPARLTDRVRGMTTSLRWGDQTCLTKTFHLEAGASGDELAAALQAALGSRAKASQTPEPLRQAFAEAQVTGVPEQVRLECTLSSPQLQGKSLELVNWLFD